MTHRRRCGVAETLNVLSGLLREHVADAGTAVILSNFAFWKDTTLRAGILPDRGRLCGGGVLSRLDRRRPRSGVALTPPHHRSPRWATMEGSTSRHALVTAGTRSHGWIACGPVLVVEELVDEGGQHVLTGDAGEARRLAASRCQTLRARSSADLRTCDYVTTESRSYSSYRVKDLRSFDFSGSR